MNIHEVQNRKVLIIISFFSYILPFSAIIIVTTSTNTTTTNTNTTSNSTTMTTNLSFFPVKGDVDNPDCDAGPPQDGTQAV